MTFNTALHQLQQSEDIAIITHVQPDGDAIGSCLALADILERAGKKKVTLYCQDKVPALLEFLHGHQKFKNSLEDGQQFDLSIAVDCSDENRMGTCFAVFKAGKKSMNIDHHVSNTFYADTNLVDIKAAATGEIIYRIGKELTDNLGKHSAEALYTAISTDTGSFCFRNTTAQSYRIASELIEIGIDIERVTTLLYKTNRLERIRLLAKALSSLELFENNKIAVITITQRDLTSTGAMESEMENMVNYVKNIVGVEIGILLKEADDSTSKISLRSKGRIDVSLLAGQFGGGGHQAAAGASLPMDVEQARKEVLAAARKMLGAGTQ